MKRIHLFEFEDYGWFPNWIRQCMTRLIVVIHKILGSEDELAALLARALTYTESTRIIDLCTGSGGPMPEVLHILKTKHGFDHVELTLTDLYPNLEMAKRINSEANADIHYVTKPVDATNIDPALHGVRTMICSLHHMRPEIAHHILKDARQKMQPICVFEISDNSYPTWLWWLALLPNFIMAFFITPFIKPLTWQQLVFTYLIPIIPLFFAWDGAVSNARTYTLQDMDKLLEGLSGITYTWEKGIIKGRSKKLYLLGLPNSSLQD
jgi:hypothetical protein